MADALSQQGRDALAAGDLDAAIELFAQVLEQRRAVEAHGEKAVECAPAYVEYGKALLRKAQAADDPFGSKVPKETPAVLEPLNGDPAAAVPPLRVVSKRARVE
ncbi:hypothetical protein EMIHUDRAFT_238720 [Emiliania huxleyi CCMP1516]|uniref:MIT domain-containing protein n=2 Tax=Emiliania huxleyi TaxID=2903 RepID=A0A0D3JL98_EMIH1|nr:hypothetical protein EMIHUDRAFT_238720 [Emiliania huxleyi CCMP1516]EOD24283.1 hypothetical protein EMIHUDRAFT_238720 [Emiliania huxleyi CCMP1516]|eukprot:XP_005776712.1 hypothetical protein EMIHUDRAFT_238720 [Emiliania huxleyi CCMP1516]